MSASANCPSCGGLITYKLGSSVVVICPHCNSAVARTDRDLADLGKVAAIVDTESPLTVGLTGIYKGVKFQLTGRAQLQHQAGGVWDEWYAAFSDGRWGWLAEAQGRFFLSFEIPNTKVVEFDRLLLGETVPGLAMPLTVAEKGTALYAAAEGEIPFRLVPGSAYQYADLSGAHAEFGTLDFSDDPPRLYLGAEITLQDIGIKATHPGHEKHVLAANISCPHCGGALELRAPDQAQRVACPYCGSLLDVQQGSLKFLETLKPARQKPILPMGATAEFENVKLTVIGFVTRSTKIEGIRYYWGEYLLYHPQIGFRWLVHDNNHWTYVKAVPPGLVHRGPGKDVTYNGHTFKRFQDSTAVVESVLGEFYWKVAIGETVEASDYIRPPLMLSKEVSEGTEINWSVGEYVPPKEIQKKFNLSFVASPTTIAQCQPFPYKGIYKPWGVALLAAGLCGLLMLVLVRPQQVYQQTLTLSTYPVPSQPGTPADKAPQLAQTGETTQTFFSEPFELGANRNIRISAQAPVENTWVYLEGDLIDEQTGLVQAFDVPVEFYHGVEDGESWSEGSRLGETYVSAMPPGKYTLRIEAQREKWTAPLPIEVTVEQGVPRMFHLILLLVGVSVLPLLIFFWHLSFDSRRWKESMYNPYPKSSSGDD